MNANFTAVMDAIDTISQAEPPVEKDGFSIPDAGVYRGQVGLGEGANFSLLTGAGGATGVAAADAACDAAFPGSHAELDILVLWKAANEEVLPPPAPAYAWWASTVTPFPVGSDYSQIRRTSDCKGWTDNTTGRGGFLRNNGTLDDYGIDIQLSNQSCTADNMAIACFSDPVEDLQAIQ